jgi:hypothetical protein
LAAGSGDGQATAVLESSLSDVEVQATIVLMDTDVGLIARGADDTNYLLLAATVGAGFRLFKRVAGSFTQLGTTDSTTPANGDVLKISCNGTSIRCYRNGAELTNLAATDGAGLTNTKHGIRSFNDTASRFDTFSIAGLAGGANRRRRVLI